MCILAETEAVSIPDVKPDRYVSGKLMYSWVCSSMLLILYYTVIQVYWHMGKSDPCHATY